MTRILPAEPATVRRLAPRSETAARTFASGNHCASDVVLPSSSELGPQKAHAAAPAATIAHAAARSAAARAHRRPPPDASTGSGVSGAGAGATASGFLGRD